MTPADILRSERRQAINSAAHFETELEHHMTRAAEMQAKARRARQLHADLGIAIVRLEGPHAVLDLPPAIDASACDEVTRAK